MVKTHEWSPTSRGKVLGLGADSRNSLQDITEIVNIPRSTVSSIKSQGTGINKPRSGRPRKLSTRDIWQIVRFLHTNKTTCRYSLTQLKDYFKLEVHENTIRKTLQEAGYCHRVARCRPYLNKWDRKCRLKFAKEHRDWTVEDWGKVLFS